MVYHLHGHTWNMLGALSVANENTYGDMGDEEHLKKGINKILSGTFFTQKEHYEITDSDMRSMLRRYSGTQMVSNFRPTTALCIIFFVM